MDIKGKILLTRIDNRLVHGQVGVTWTNALSANYIIVIDEDAAGDKLQQMLMEGVAKSCNVKIRFFTTKDFARAIESSTSDQRMMLVVRYPHVIVDLLELGVPMEHVNIGNMHFERGKVPLNKKVYVNHDEIECFKYMLKKGTYLFIQDVPDSIHEKVITMHDLMNFS